MGRTWTVWMAAVLLLTGALGALTGPGAAQYGQGDQGSEDAPDDGEGGQGDGSEQQQDDGTSDGPGDGAGDGSGDGSDDGGGDGSGDDATSDDQQSDQGDGDGQTGDGSNQDNGTENGTAGNETSGSSNTTDGGLNQTDDGTQGNTTENGTQGNTTGNETGGDQDGNATTFGSNNTTANGTASNQSQDNASIGNETGGNETTGENDRSRSNTSTTNTTAPTNRTGAGDATTDGTDEGDQPDDGTAPASEDGETGDGPCTTGAGEELELETITVRVTPRLPGFEAITLIEDQAMALAAVELPCAGGAPQQESTEGSVTLVSGDARVTLQDSADVGLRIEGHPDAPVNVTLPPDASVVGQHGLGGEQVLWIDLGDAGAAAIRGQGITLNSVTAVVTVQGQADFERVDDLGLYDAQFGDEALTSTGVDPAQDNGTGPSAGADRAADNETISTGPNTSEEAEEGIPAGPLALLALAGAGLVARRRW